MMEKPEKAKMKRKPKLSEEEKREKVREALLKKKVYESRALAIVEQLLEPDINGNMSGATIVFPPFSDLIN